eukprot:TRINITY_DN13139_c0_g1_i1.p1 TRINITY_DN13139_c0_g1~~TRINITY_DN13139_c0_g1_i1.p1  ORF type:complete len:250 (-),score=50.94 TRINITY_DN13139_c0_g1_i1:64-813(-)
MGCLNSKEGYKDVKNNNNGQNQEQGQRQGGGGGQGQGGQKIQTNMWTQNPRELAVQTHFIEDEVFALKEMFDTVSNSVVRNGLITKEEFSLALFKSQRTNIFSERVFHVFDTKNTGTIDFAEFVKALSVFSHRAPMPEKARFAFSLYDIDKTGQLKPKEVKKFLSELFNDNPDVNMSESVIDQIVENTFEEVDTDKNGMICLEEWLALVSRKPAVISYMTLPALKNITKDYPDFVFKKESAENSPSAMQ